MTASLLFVLLASGPVTPYTLTHQLDINSASLAQVESLPISVEAAQGIYRYVTTYSMLQSIYDLRKVKELSADDFERIKLLILIKPRPYRREGARYVHTVQRELAAEESPSQAAVEEWQERPQQIGEPGEWKLRLRLEWLGAQNRESGRGRNDLIEKRRLPDPGVAVHDQRRAHARAGTVQQPADPRNLIGAPG